MKIGIITFHKVYSFGATLQCYALQKYFKNMDYEVEIIDYSIHAYEELRQLHRVKAFVQKAYRVLKNPIKYAQIIVNEKQKKSKQKIEISNLKERNTKFEKFWKDNYQLSLISYERYTELKNNPPVYDAYVCGSDQIWNPSFCDMDDNYYLEFAPIQKRLAYAPSFGVTDITNRAGKTISHRLNKIPYLSVREKTGQSIIRELIDKEVPVVIDPTFLLEKKEWEQFIHQETKAENSYVLTYFIGDDEYIQSYLNEIKIIFPEENIINLVFDYCNHGPMEFISLISGAKFVLTNSFHGMAFCINLNVPFAIGKSMKDYTINSGFSRMLSLLEKLELEHRIISKDNKLNETWVAMKFDNVNEMLDKWRAESMKYLEISLETIRGYINNEN